MATVNIGQATRHFPGMNRPAVNAVDLLVEAVHRAVSGGWSLRAVAPHYCMT